MKKEKKKTVNFSRAFLTMLSNYFHFVYFNVSTPLSMTSMKKVESVLRQHLVFFLGAVNFLFFGTEGYFNTILKRFSNATTLMTFLFSIFF